MEMWAAAPPPRRFPASVHQVAASKPPLRSARVYPRKRGGTYDPRMPPDMMLGLSPQARGNRVRAARLRLGLGSIPASAGEPKDDPTHRSEDGVYPRKRGEPTAPFKPPAFRWVYPRKRGEPSCVTGWPVSAGVYPRKRGGTIHAATATASILGLSPQARGNLRAAGPRPDAAGSIPASAGEPPLEHSPMGAVWVYPRKRGGTELIAVSAAFSDGLSPQARGNP